MSFFLFSLVLNTHRHSSKVTRIYTSYGPKPVANSSSSGEICEDDQVIRADLLAFMEEQYGFTAEAVLQSLRKSEIDLHSATYKMLKRTEGDTPRTCDPTRVEDCGKLCIFLIFLTLPTFSQKISCESRT